MIEFPKKKYKTIVMDPPWPIETGFNTKTLHSPMTRVPYQTMKKQEIEDFPINKFTDTDCALFLWTIQLFLPFSLELIKHWGFKYHCLMTWDKMDGINCWGFFRNSEFIIYCYKGKPNLDLTKKFIPTSFREHRTKHSVKPQTFYNLIRRVTQEPRIDIFARRKIEGFDVWGNDPELEVETLEAFS